MRVPLPFGLSSGLVLALAVSGAQAQTMPPTTQQLQQQHDQTMRNESATVQRNLEQSIRQNPPQPQPVITPSGRAVTRPPGHISTPGPNGSDPDR
jgi:hypothetical protein